MMAAEARVVGGGEEGLHACGKDGMRDACGVAHAAWCVVCIGFLCGRWVSSGSLLSQCFTCAVRIFQRLKKKVNLFHERV